MNLDGDFASGIIPNVGINKILDDPFALKVLLHNEVYCNPNRFCSHWFMAEYFRTIPFVLQKFINPIDSIYLSCAFIKIAIHIFLLLVLSAAISGIRNIFTKDFLIAAVLIVPLFQANGFTRSIGIIDQSITYNFFYSLPLSLLIFFLLPLMLIFYFEHQMNFKLITKLIYFFLAVILPFSGPLIPGVILIVCTLILSYGLYNYFRNPQRQFLKEVPKFYIIVMLLSFIFSLYSLFIGFNNIILITDSLSIGERYSRLLYGISTIFHNIGWNYDFKINMGLILLIICVAVNSTIIKIKFNQENGQRIFKLLKWLVIFSILYIFLLPLGGFRYYRPYILRYDTYMPVTLCLFLYFGVSSCFILKTIAQKFKYIYIAGIICLLLLYTYIDKPDSKGYFCERNAIEIIAKSDKKSVMLNCDCSIMAWNTKFAKENMELNAELLQYFGITKHKKLYFQK